MRIINQKELFSHGNIKSREKIIEIMEAGLEASDPYNNTFKMCRLENGVLHIGGEGYAPIGDPSGIDEFIYLDKEVKRIFVFGAGKGIQRVALALEKILGDYIAGGRIIIKHGDDHGLKKIRVSYGGHPVPDEDCIKAACYMVKDIKAAHLTKEDLVITIIGNGASSLMTLPPKGISLGEIRKITQILQIEKGLPTNMINVVRNQLDMLKGGRLTRLLYPARMIHFEIIDINEYNILNSRGYEGWTKNNYWLHNLPELRTAEDAIELLKKNDCWSRFSKQLQNYLMHESPKNKCLSAEEFKDWGGRFFGIMTGKNNFLNATYNKCVELGYKTFIMTRKTGIEAKDAGTLMARIAVSIDNDCQPFSPPCAMIMTGELLVNVGKQKGIGGRNQEFCISAAKIISGHKNIVFASADTDGTDGPAGDFNYDASRQGCFNLAGGVVDGYTLEEAKEEKIDLDDALKTHNTSNALWKINCGIWATHNISLNDLTVILINKR